jgi:uncharacterized membrane protein
MAGIGFELRNLLHKGSYLERTLAYGYAGVISAGPWIIAILGILCLDFITAFDRGGSDVLIYFRILITYSIASSLIFSSFMQHSFTNYVADRLFEKAYHAILPAYNGGLILLSWAAAVFGYVSMMWLFPGESILFKFVVTGIFIVLCDIWFTTNLLSGLQRYKVILMVFLIGYSSTVGFSYLFRHMQLLGLLSGFLLGQFILLLGMILIIYRGYPSQLLVHFSFFKNFSRVMLLISVSFFYQVGIWADKFIFWFAPSTSHAVFGPLRASNIYDTPIFLAYLLMIPGMAIFLFRLETDFVDVYHEYYKSFERGDTLSSILRTRYQMVQNARNGILDVVRIQGLTLLLIFLVGTQILMWLRVSTYYIYLLDIDVVGTSLLIVFLGLLNLLSYLNRMKQAFILTFLFAVLNIIFTFMTIDLGVFYFGYGFVAALVVISILATLFLDYNFNRLEYITLMQR